MLGVSVARRHYDNRECLSGPLLGPEQGEDVTYVIGLPCVDVKDRACVEELGSPGGAARLGPTHKDHPAVEALPPQGE